MRRRPLCACCPVLEPSSAWQVIDAVGEPSRTPTSRFLHLPVEPSVQVTDLAG
jgi:hypothetical protein